MERDLKTGSHWYGGYYTDADGTDHKLGYMSLSYSDIKPDNESSLFLVNTKFSLNFTELGNDYEILVEGKDLYNADPPFELITSQYNTSTTDMIASAFTFFQDKTLNHTNFNNGTRTNFSQKNIEITLKDVYSADDWIDKNSRKIGDVMYTNELFDGKLTKSKYTLTDIKNQIVDGIEYQFFELISPSREDGNNSDIYLYKDSKNWIKFSLDLGANFFVDFRLEPEERATDLSNLADFYILNSDLNVTNVH